MRGVSRWLSLALFLVAGQAQAVRCPNILFALDRSGSMAADTDGNYPTTPWPGGAPNPLFGGQSKWQLLQAEVNALLDAYGTQVPFGLETFTFDADAVDDQTCYDEAMIAVEPDHGTATIIESTVANAMPAGGTNTGEAIKRAAADRVLQDPLRHNYVVLITDGDPNCNTGDLGPKGMAGDAAYTIAQITAAAAQTPSLHTFVVGFDASGGVNPDNLNDMAKAGLEPIAECQGTADAPCYYSASDEAKLMASLNSIINQVIGGEIGSTMCDDSCLVNGCLEGQYCASGDELRPTPYCVTDPCHDVVCKTAGSYCVAGKCVPGCTTPCSSVEKCDAGKCVPDPCASAGCQKPMVCNPVDGTCMADPCAAVTCAEPLVCSLPDGACVDDPCRIIECPTGYTCQAGGNCEVIAVPDTTTTPPRRSVGCDLSSRASSTGTSTGMASLAGLLLALRALGSRHRRRRSAAR